MLNSVHLELLHNFTTLTSYSLSNDVALRTLWRIKVPQLGFSVDFVMRGILAISALHMSRTFPSKHDYYLAMAMSEHEAALREALSVLRNVTAGNCSALYVFSIMTFYYTVAAPRTVGDMLLANASGVADWLVVFRGLRGISDVATRELLDGPFAALFIHGQARIDESFSAVATSQGWNLTNEHMQLETLRRLVSRATKEPQLLDVYLRSINELELCFQNNSARFQSIIPGMTAGGNPGESIVVPETAIVLSWAYQVCNEFVELLVQRRGEALVIFAYYCVLLKSLDGCWWMHGRTSHFLQEIWEALTQQQKLWIQWPLEEIGLQL
jgi:hypothetical protein